jgi:hypothetical protein
VGSFESAIGIIPFVCGLGDMNRLEVIKSLIHRRSVREAPQRKGMYAAANPDQFGLLKKRGKYVKKKRIKISCTQFGILQGLEHRRKDWIKESDRKKTGLSIKRRHEPHALTRIAEKLKRGWQA